MAFTKEKLKGFIAGVFLTMGTWMWVITLRDQIISISPIQNQYILGLVFVIISWLLARK